MCLAIPGKIVERFADAGHLPIILAIVEVAGVRRKVDLSLLLDDPPDVGDWVLIHVGFAMSKISERDALDQMRTLAALGETEAAMQEVRGYGAGAGAPDDQVQVVSTRENGLNSDLHNG